MYKTQPFPDNNLKTRLSQPYSFIKKQAWWVSSS